MGLSAVNANVIKLLSKSHLAGLTLVAGMIVFTPREKGKTNVWTT